jgi:excisionase family DNA binding protein
MGAHKRKIMKYIEPIAITKKELAEALRLSIRTIDNLVREQRIPSFKIGASRRFDVTDVIAALRETSLVVAR